MSLFIFIIQNPLKFYTNNNIGKVLTILKGYLYNKSILNFISNLVKMLSNTKKAIHNSIITDMPNYVRQVHMKRNAVEKIAI